MRAWGVETFSAVLLCEGKCSLGQPKPVATPHKYTMKRWNGALVYSCEDCGQGRVWGMLYGVPGMKSVEAGDEEVDKGRDKKVHDEGLRQ